MKILQVTNFFKPSFESGGVARVSYNISRYLVEHGHDVVVYTTNRSLIDIKIETNKPLFVDKITVYYFENLKKYFSKIPPFPYCSLLTIRKNVQNFDVIHIHEHRTILAIIAHHYAKKYEVPYILQSHGSVLPHFQKQGLKKLFDFLFGYKILHDASKIIALTNVEAKQYMQMGIDASKISIIPNGIDLKEYEDLPKKGEFRKKYSIKDNEKIILFLGRINKIKGIDLLIDAFSQLKLELNNIKLIIAGPKYDYFSLLNENVINLGLSDSVLFTGPLYGKDKHAAYVDADILVYPSFFEIFGLVPFEAIMCGTPVIVTDNCGCSEIIRNADCGYLVKYGDIPDLKKKMKFLIENSDVRKLCVLNGKKFIDNNLRCELVIEKIVKLYYEALDEKRSYI